MHSDAFSFDAPFAQAFGWSEFFATQIADTDLSNCRIGRVISEEKNTYKVQFSLDETRLAEVSGKFYYTVSRRFDFPATGDWVVCDASTDATRTQIHRVLDRRTLLYRRNAGRTENEQVLAANVDTLFVMTSLNGDLNPRRLERYLVLCRDSGVTPVIVLSKADLAPNAAETALALEQQFSGVKVYAVSAQSGAGMTAVDAYLRPGQSVAIVGSSGVGKSTLVNYLLGRDAMRTQEIRDKDDKGKHTTTARQMFLLPGGGLLIDTPGMRELQLFSHEDGLASEFADVEEIALRCRFSNCEHRTEPDCAIQAAIADGELELGRWENFQKMRRELAFQARKLDKAKASEEKEKWKKVHKALKDNPKYRR